MANGVLTAASITTNQKNGRPEIIYETALAEWRANYGDVKKSDQPREPKPKLEKPPRPPKEEKPKPEPKKRGRKPKPKPNPEPELEEEEEEEEEEEVVLPPAPEAAPAPGHVPGIGPSKAELDRQLARIKLQKEAIELKKIQGSLLDKQKVYATLYGFGQELRTALMSLPDRVIDEILASPDRNVAHNKLTEAIAKELERMAEFQERELTSERK